MNNRGLLSNLIGATVVILVGIALLPSVNNLMKSQQSNVTSSADTLLGLTTVIFALAIGAAAIGIVMMGLRNAGILGYETDDSSNNTEEIETKPVQQNRKQTYLDYVKERLTVEKLMRWRI